jgi:hypothetical protein
LVISDAWIGWPLLAAMNNSRPERGKPVFAESLSAGLFNSSLD